MEHLLLKATVTAATDQGTFTAVISTASVDREGDVVEPQAVVDALRKWVPLGKKVPLSWGHSLAAEDIIGTIDPATAAVAGDEVQVDGWVDQATPRGKDAWRLVKSGTLGFSYGYLTLKSTARKPQGRHISELDIFEITATPAPMNGDTRVVSFKSAEELRADSERIAREVADSRIDEAVAELPEVIEGDVVEPEPATAKDALALIESLALPELQAVKTALGFTLQPVKDPEALRSDSRRIERELAEERLPKDIPPKQETPPGPLTKALDGIDTNTLTAEQVADTLDTLAFDDVHLHVRVVTPDELAGITSGEVKAVWTTAYINNLPDSAFLHIEGGGSKDSEGKTTPRTLRHFPYKDADGKVDVPHLRNALSRIPQSNLSQDVKDRLMSRARQILDQQKSVDVTDKETKSRSVDPLRKRSEELALEIASDGMSLRKPPVKPAEPVRQGPSPEDLKRKSRELMEEVLSYGME